MMRKRLNAATTQLRLWMRNLSAKPNRTPYRRRTRLFLERLENRCTPTNVSWNGGAGTLNWGDQNNWSTGAVPGINDDVTISIAVSGPINIGANAYSVRSLNDTTAQLSIASGGSLSLAAVAANSIFGQNVTVQAGGALTIGAGASVLLDPGQTLAVDGSMTLATGDTLSLSSNYAGGTQVVVNGTLTATGTTFNQPGGGYFTSLTVNSGGELIASGSTFTLSQMTLSAGSVFKPGDLSNDAFNLPLYLPASDVALLSAAGGGSDNQSFDAIDILSSVLAAGQILNLNAIGVDSTANLLYVLPGAFTVDSGATLNVGVNVPVLIQAGQTLTVNGTMTATGDTISLSSNYAGGTQILVNGTLTATGTTFNAPGGGYFTSLTVNSGGELIAHSCSFTLGQMTLSAGSTFNPGDLANDSFNLPLYLPAGDVALLSAAGGGSDNQSFDAIDILSSSLTNGQTLDLNAIGTATTANLVYVFPGAFTVQGGTFLNVGAYVPVLLQAGQTLTVDGTMTLATGDTFSLSSNYAGGTQILVNGILSATGATFNAPGGGYSTNITVDSGGQLDANYSTFAPANLNLNNNAIATMNGDIIYNVFTINSGATIAIANSDFSNLGNNSLVAVGDPNATINLESNYWGTTVTTQIAAKILDHNDDNTRPYVDYSHYLSTLSTNQPPILAAIANQTAARSLSPPRPPTATAILSLTASIRARLPALPSTPPRAYSPTRRPMARPAIPWLSAPPTTATRP